MPSKSPTAITNPKRRWLQFSLRTLLIAVTFAALCLGWWNHRQNCLARAEEHQQQGLECWTRTIHSWAGSWSDDIEKAASELDKNYLRLKKHHDRLAETYRRAVWQPWLRLSIHEAPPDTLAALEASLSASQH